MTLTRDTYGWVPLPSANPHPEAWLGVGGLIGPSWRAPTALRGLRGALGRWGTSEGRTGLKNAFFGVRFGAATGQEPPDAPKGLRIKSSSLKGYTFRALRGRPAPDGPRSYVSRFCGPSWYARVREAFLVWCGRRTSRSLSVTPERFKTPVNTGASQFGRHDILLPDSRVKNDVKFR